MCARYEVSMIKPDQEEQGVSTDKDNANNDDNTDNDT